jgi:putative ABC transport system permease protein
MDLFRLALRNIGDSAFRSWVVVLCAALMAGLAIGATLVIRGAEDSLRLVLERLGADIMVIPSGNENRVEQALLMGVPVTVWMPQAVVPQIAALPHVAAVSPQLFLSTMRGASCCSVSDMFMIAYDPATDFTLRPWLERHLQGGLRLGEAIGGHYVFVPKGEDAIRVYGYSLDLKGNLEPTGSGLDQSMFFTFETAREIARLSPMQAERELVIAPDSISAALVKVEAGADPHQVAAQIERTIPRVTAIESTDLFRDQRDQVLGLLKSAAALSSIAWVMSIVLIGLVTSMTTTERRLQIGVLRALGATRTTVFQSLLAEGAILALVGGAAGIALAVFVVFLFRHLIIQLMGMPFPFPTPLSLLAMALGGLALALVSVTLATLFPTWKISHQEPGTAMKEW